MYLQDSVQRSLQNPAEKNPVDLHRFAKIENLGSAYYTLASKISRPENYYCVLTYKQRYSMDSIAAGLTLLLASWLS